MRRHFFQKRPEVFQCERVGAVRESLRGIVVHFEKQTVNAGGSSRARERLDELGLAAARVSFSAGQLHRMRHIEDHGIAQFAHNRKRSHVHHKILVAEGYASFRKNDFLIAGACYLFRGIGDIPRRKKLPFFDVGGAAGLADGDEKIRLAREKRRNLQHVANFGGRTNVPHFVHVREDGQPGALFDFGEHAKAGFQAGPSERPDGGAIGFVVRSLENQRNTGGAAISARRVAIEVAWVSLSITQGPAMRNKGALPPRRDFTDFEAAGRLHQSALDCLRVPHANPEDRSSNWVCRITKINSVSGFRSVFNLEFVNAIGMVMDSGRQMLHLDL